MRRIKTIDIEETEQCYKALLHYDDPEYGNTWASIYFAKSNDELDRFLEYDPIRDIGNIWFAADHAFKENDEFVHGVMLICINSLDMVKREYWMPLHAWEVFSRLAREVADGIVEGATVEEGILSDIHSSAARVTVEESWRDNTPFLEESKRLRDHVVQIGKNCWRRGADIVVTFWNDSYAPANDCGSLLFQVLRDGKHVINGGIINHGRDGTPDFSIHT